MRRRLRMGHYLSFHLLPGNGWTNNTRPMTYESLGLVGVRAPLLAGTLWEGQHGAATQSALHRLLFSRSRVSSLEHASWLPHSASWCRARPAVARSARAGLQALVVLLLDQNTLFIQRFWSDIRSIWPIDCFTFSVDTNRSKELAVCAERFENRTT